MTARRASEKKLGELLAARGKLDRAVLLDALRHQRATGGRLGTCLLELDAVSEADLLDVLSGQLKLPFVDADELRSLPAEALRLLPVKIAVARCAVPVRASGTQLSVAMLDPHDLAALDELAFVSGRRIRPHVALEVRLQEALSRNYGHDIPSRYVKLIDRLNRARFLWKPETGEGAGGSAIESPRYGSPYPEAPAGGLRGDASSPSVPPAAPRKPPPPPDFHPTPRPTPPPPPSVAPASASPALPPTPPSASETPARKPPPRSAETAVPKDYDDTVQRLQSAAERDEVADALIDYLRSRVELGLLMMLRRNRALGWRAVGIEPASLASLAVPLDAPSVVHALIDGAPLHRGPLSALSGNASLHDRLGPDIADLIALPIRVRKRLVAVLVAASRDASLAAELADEMQHLAVEASAALERIVLRRKLLGS